MNELKKTIKRGWKLKSRFLALMLVISMVVSLLPVGLLPMQQAVAAESSGLQNSAPMDGFQDVSPTDWFYDAVGYVQKNEIFSGTSAGIFSPQGTMTRAMYVTALGRMAGVDISEYATSTFADVQAGAWYAPYVEWAVKKGITVGTSDRNYSPDATVSREQMATMTLRYLESYGISYQKSTRVTTEPSDLANVSPWAVDAVVKLWQAGLFVGDANGNFNPHAQASRAEAAVLFMRNDAVVQAWRNQNQVTPTPTPTSTPEPSSGNSGNSGSNNGGNSGGTNNTEYALTFESNGGTAVTGQTVKYGSKAVAPEVPIKEGYTFGGWYSDSSLTIPYNFTEAVKSKITLHAKWTIKNLTVSFDSNGGPMVNSQSVNYGGTIAEPNAPTRAGYTFGGWYSDSNLTMGYSFTTAVTNNMTLYAKWTARYTVDFDSNGGSAVADQTVNEGIKAVAPDAPTKIGYVFSGWYSDSTLTIVYDFTTAVVTSNITLYAKWTVEKKNSYTVKFESNEGTAVADQTVNEGAVAAAPDAPTRTGHTFDGWYSDSSLTSHYGFTATVTSNITLYAKWTINSYTVSFESNGGSVVTSQSVNYDGLATVPSTPTQEGYTFSGWYSDNGLNNDYSFTTKVKADMTLYAKWTINSYTVSFNSNGGSVVASQSVNYRGTAMEPEAPTRAGHAFDGWYSDSDLRSPYGFTAVVTGDITLYAKWNADYTVNFESNGGTAIAARTVQAEEVLNKLPAPAKEGQIFQGWFRDEAFSLIFAEGSTVNENMTLYAKYIDNVSNAVVNIPSHSKLDVAPSFTIAVNAGSNSMTADQVRAGMTFIDVTNPDPVEPAITGANGSFTVASAAKDGMFVEGNTYQLTLTDDRLTFQGQDVTTRIYMFSVAKQEVLDIPLNPKMIYLRFVDVTNMMLDGVAVGSAAISATTLAVGDSESGLAAANGGNGTFQYTGDTHIQVGDTVAIYEGVRPDQRTLTTTGTDDGDIAYVQITAISGTTYTYTNADIMQVLFMPDVLPVSVTSDTDGEEDNGSITVEQAAMNYSDVRYELFGLSELTTVDIGDFITFYEGGLAEDDEDFKVISYGRITSIVPAAEMMVIAYDDATAEDIKHVFDIYQEQEIDGETLLSEEEITQLEDQIEQQAIDSGFVDQAASYLSTLAMETDVFKTHTKVKGLATSRIGSKVSVENLTVVAKLDTKVKNIAGRTSGVSATLQVGADIVIRIHEESDLVIHMTGTFLEEISLDLKVDGNAEWEEACIKYLGCATLPIPKDYRVTANLDVYSYTGLNITAEIATVEHDKLAEVLGDWDASKNSGKLGKVLDIATEIQALIDGVQDSGVDAESLKERYKEMMENETDWVRLTEIEIFKAEERVAKGIIHVVFTAEFVVNINANLTIGADFNYTTAKRLSATIRVKSFSGNVHTTQLAGDGNYQFTFYVMGTIGLRAGIQLELKAGIGSVEWNSIGITVEPGAYVKLWGYFYYQLKNISGKQTTHSFGALYVEVGIYLDSGVGAQVGDGLFSVGVPIYENEWLLYTAGEPNNVINFAYPQDDTLGVNLTGTATSVPMPEQWRRMSTFDLKTGESDSVVYNFDKFDIVVDNPNFKYNPTNQKIEVVDKKLAVATGNLVITWKNAPLSFNSEPLKRTIPLMWLAREGDYTLQLDPQNGGLTQVSSHAYNTAVSVTDPTYQGYTFDGWYTAASGGTKKTIPSEMPAEDLYLYAHWTANTNTPYTVQHYLIDPNTRTASSPEYIEQLTGTTDTEIQITPDKYKSLGYTDGTVSGVLIKGDGSTVVRIDYYPTNRTMTFDRGFEGALISTITAPFGKNIASNIPLPVRAGYTFAGWSSDVPSTMPTVDTTYTASWTARTDTHYQIVHLQQNIASDTYTVIDRETYRGTTDNATSHANVTPKLYDGFYFDPTVAGTVQADLIASNGSTVLKLYYKRNSYEMKINYNGADLAEKILNVPYGATTELYLGTPAWQGRSLAGWLQSPTSTMPTTTMPAHDVEFIAQWTLNTYTVSFNSNGATEEVADQTVNYGDRANEPLEMSKDGYVFGGWYSDSGLTNVYEFTTLITENIALYAKWLQTYTVSFDSRDGSEVADQQVNEGSKAIAPVAPTLEGYVFSGWHSDSDLMNVFDFTATPVTGNMTLYAKWTEKQKNSYAVSFNSNGGTVVDEQIVEEGAVAAAPTAPTREGYTFAGWFSDSGLLSSYGFTAAVTESITLYAKWTINRFTVSFNSNSGSLVTSQQVDYEGTAVEPTAPVLTGYVFSGWYSEISLENKFNFTTQVKENLTLYAKWTAVYTVSFNSNDGTAVDAQVVEFGQRVAEPEAPTRVGYTFDGWYSDSSLMEAYVFTTPITTDRTLYAKWTSMAAWQQVGEAIGLESTFEFLRLAVDSKGTIYALGAPVVNDSKIYLMKYEDGVWEQIGDKDDFPGLTGHNPGLQLAVDSQDTLYFAYHEYYGGDIDSDVVVVKKYNGTEWESVGVTGKRMGSITIAFDNDDIPYIFYLEKLVQLGDRAGVIKYVDNHWIDVGGELPEDSFFDTDHRPQIHFDQNNTPYVIYHTVDNNNDNYFVLEIMKYGNDGWQTDISIPLIDMPFERGGIYFTFGPDHMLYALWHGWHRGGKVTVKRFKESAWETVGNPEFASIEFDTTSLSWGQRVRISFDSESIPYVSYLDADSGDKVTVMKLDGSTWSVVGEAGFSAGKADGILHVIDQAGNVYVLYADYTNDKRMTVMKYNPNFDSTNE